MKVLETPRDPEKLILNPIKPLIGVVLLNFQNWSETKMCLENLTRIKTCDKEITTIVVDNGSKDDSLCQLRNSQISHLICLDSNLGYAGGCNEGIRIAIDIGCDFILLMNSDVEFPSDLLDPLMVVFQKRSEVGIVSPKIVTDELPAKIYYAGGKLSSFQMRDRLIGIGKLDSAIYNQGMYADFGIGCCLLIKREVFEKVGYLDDRFFFDYEDVDFCHRAYQAGYRTWYEPASVLIHKAPLLPRNRHRAYLLGKARMTFFYKYINGIKFWPAFFLECFDTIRVIANHLIRKRFDLAHGYLDGVISGISAHPIFRRGQCL